MLSNSNKLCEFLYGAFKNSSDFALREIILCGKQSVYIAFLGVFSDKEYVSDNIIKPLLTKNTTIENKKDFLGIVYTSKFSEVCDDQEVIKKILSGDTVIFTDINGFTVAFASITKNSISRSIEEPNSEMVVRGPREGFIESAEVNVALIRKRIRSENLKVEKLSCGKYTDTDVRILYIDGLADMDMLDRLKKRILSIKLPSVIDSGYLEQYLSETSYPLFTTVGNSEKPDKVAAKLLCGKIAIICDGSPVVLTIPYVFVESLQSAEDYLKIPYYATFVRILRIIGLFISLYLPSIYVVAMHFHTSAIPKKLYDTIVESRKGVPFSVFAELITILLIFELIREVGVRMPRAVGDAVSIVAGIILGDSTIKAGISSAPVIMVAALTATCSFINPPYMNSVSIIRIFNIIVARIFGLFGLVFSIMLLLIDLSRKNSFGVPYLSPFAPTSPSGLLDSVILLPKAALSESDSETKRSK